MTGDCAADAVTASGAFCTLRHAASCIPAALTARMPKNNTLLVTIFLISGFIHTTSELVLVKVYAEAQRNMSGKGIVISIIIALFFKVSIQFCMLFHYGRTFEINDLAVDPDYQRRGIATELLEKCLADMKAKGMVGVHLITAGEGVLPAFYAKYGFKKETEVILMGAEL